LAFFSPVFVFDHFAGLAFRLVDPHVPLLPFLPTATSSLLLAHHHPSRLPLTA
jgi:hypothetical protein